MDGFGDLPCAPGAAAQFAQPGHDSACAAVGVLHRVEPGAGPTRSSIAGARPHCRHGVGADVQYRQTAWPQYPEAVGLGGAAGSMCSRTKYSDYTTHGDYGAQSGR